MTSGISVCLLIVAAVGMAWFGFELTETYGGFVPWVAFGFALTLGAWALIEGAQAGERT